MIMEVAHERILRWHDVAQHIDMRRSAGGSRAGALLTAFVDGSFFRLRAEGARELAQSHARLYDLAQTASSL